MRGKRNPLGSQTSDRFIEGQADIHKDEHSRTRAAPQHSGGAGMEGGRASTHLGGGEDDDVLDIPPGEAGPYLQHQRDHPGCERSSS